MKRCIAIFLFAVASLCLFGQVQKSGAQKRIIKQWTLSEDHTEEVLLPFDTVFHLFHRYRLADRYSPLNITLGNYGLPFYQMNFFDRITDPDKFLYAYYYPVMHHHDKTIFMNTQLPFTEMVWSYGTPRETSEQTFRIRHSQNVNRFLNFGLIYDIIYSLGQYNYQRAEDKNFTLFSSYTGQKYKLYASLGINNLLAYENGGITNPEELKTLPTRDVQVNLGGLNNAKSQLKNRDLLLVQRYTVGGGTVKPDTAAKARKGSSGLSGTFSHILTWEKNRRTYSDSYPASGFYDSVYISGNTTFDSLLFRNLKNTVRFDFTTDTSRKLSVGGGVGLRNELRRFSQIIPTHDSLFADTTKWNRTSNVIVGKLYNNIGTKFRWTATGELFLTGYRAGDFEIKGVISKSFDWKKGEALWIINGSILNRQPSFWFEQWGSNNFEWNSNLKKEFRIDAGTTFSYPARRAELRFNYAIIDNYTDFHSDGLPAQHGGGLSVAALMLSKEVSAWKFHLATDLLIQQSSNREILDLPLFGTRTALFFEHLFKFKSTNGRLNFQLGADLKYNTPFHAYMYIPATGRFIRQNVAETGNYPFVDVFVNIKLKRARIFVMYDHLNSGLTGYDYFMTPSYPQNNSMLRYGIAWTFYN
ncbi:MAG: putative porin [Bacteroidales bacterium]|nr:putative porin [Bacteroidales bacterium]MBN2634346.1 putative porin [Bacteroidales bacterium]